MNKNLKNFFKKLSLYLETSIAPISNELDSDVKLLKKTYQRLVDIGGLRLLIPTEYGGLGGGRKEWIDYNMQLAMYSGALLFLQAQHQIAIFTLKNLLPRPKVKKLLRFISDHHAGIAWSQTVNKQLLEVKPVNEGFKLSGKLAWVTGWRFFDNIFLSFDHDGIGYFTLLPFRDKKQKDAWIKISAPIKTVAFNSTNTVTLTMKNWFVAKKDIIATMPIPAKKPRFEHPTIYCFAGAAEALLEITKQGKYFNVPEIKRTQRLLLNEGRDYHEKIVAETMCPFELRALGLEYAEKCARFARIACGSAAFLATHPVARINREIWQYTISGYSLQQLNAYIKEMFL